MIPLGEKGYIFDAPKQEGQEYTLRNQKQLSSSDLEIIQKKVKELPKSKNHGGWLVIHDVSGILGKMNTYHFIEILTSGWWNRTGHYFYPTDPKKDKGIILNAMHTSRLLGGIESKGLIRSRIGVRAANFFKAMMVETTTSSPIPSKNRLKELGFNLETIEGDPTIDQLAKWNRTNKLHPPKDLTPKEAIFLQKFEAMRNQTTLDSNLQYTPENQSIPPSPSSLQESRDASQISQTPQAAQPGQTDLLASLTRPSSQNKNQVGLLFPPSFPFHDQKITIEFLAEFGIALPRKSLSLDNLPQNLLQQLRQIGKLLGVQPQTPFRDIKASSEQQLILQKQEPTALVQHTSSFTKTPDGVRVNRQLLLNIQKLLNQFRLRIPTLDTALLSLSPTFFIPQETLAAAQKALIDQTPRPSAYDTDLVPLKPEAPSSQVSFETDAIEQQLSSNPSFWWHMEQGTNPEKIQALKEELSRNSTLLLQPDIKEFILKEEIIQSLEDQVAEALILTINALDREPLQGTQIIQEYIQALIKSPNLTFEKKDALIQALLQKQLTDLFLSCFLDKEIAETYKPRVIRTLCESIKQPSVLHTGTFFQELLIAALQDTSMQETVAQEIVKQVFIEATRPSEHPEHSMTALLLTFFQPTSLTKIQHFGDQSLTKHDRSDILYQLAEAIVRTSFQQKTPPPKEIEQILSLFFQDPKIQEEKQLEILQLIPLLSSEQHPATVPLLQTYLGSPIDPNKFQLLFAHANPTDISKISCMLQHPCDLEQITTKILREISLSEDDRRRITFLLMKNPTLFDTRQFGEIRRVLPVLVSHENISLKQKIRWLKQLLSSENDFKTIGKHIDLVVNNDEIMAYLFFYQTSENQHKIIAKKIKEHLSTSLLIQLISDFPTKKEEILDLVKTYLPEHTSEINKIGPVLFIQLKNIRSDEVRILLLDAIEMLKKCISSMTPETKIGFGGFLLHWLHDSTSSSVWEEIAPLLDELLRDERLGDEIKKQWAQQVQNNTSPHYTNSALKLQIDKLLKQETPQQLPPTEETPTQDPSVPIEVPRAFLQDPLTLFREDKENFFSIFIAGITGTNPDQRKQTFARIETLLYQTDPSYNQLKKELTKWLKDTFLYGPYKQFVQQFIPILSSRMTISKEVFSQLAKALVDAPSNSDQTDPIHALFLDLLLQPLKTQNKITTLSHIHLSINQIELMQALMTTRANPEISSFVQEKIESLLTNFFRKCISNYELDQVLKVQPKEALFYTSLLTFFKNPQISSLRKQQIALTLAPTLAMQQITDDQKALFWIFFKQILDDKDPKNKPFQQQLKSMLGLSKI